MVSKYHEMSSVEVWPEHPECVHEREMLSFRWRVVTFILIASTGRTRTQVFFAVFTHLGEKRRNAISRPIAPHMDFLVRVETTQHFTRFGHLIHHALYRLSLLGAPTERYIFLQQPIHWSHDGSERGHIVTVKYKHADDRPDFGDICRCPHAAKCGNLSLVR